MNAYRWAARAHGTVLVLIFPVLFAGCAAVSETGRAPHPQATGTCPNVRTCADPLVAAQEAAVQAAQRTSHDSRANGHWLACASSAYEAAVVGGKNAPLAANLATGCTERLIEASLRDGPLDWTEGRRKVGPVEMRVEFRDLSPELQHPLELVRAAEVSMKLYGGHRHSIVGFGVPLVAWSPRCNDRPACSLMPPEGVFRAVTAWIEPGTAGSAPRLVIADPDHAVIPVTLGVLSADRSAPYALAAGRTALRRQSVWGLLGGRKLGNRSGVYLLEDYDPSRRAVVMIHGLGSSPLIWAKASNAIWGDPLLRKHFQVWHMVYQTNAPLLITRRRMKQYLDRAFDTLDPECHDAARQGIVLVGHSMGGVLARLLSADSNNVLWSAAFNVPPEALHGAQEDLDVIRETFLFSHYPGIDRVIFMAAPHHGSPSADDWLGRVMNRLVGRRAPELKAVARVAAIQPNAVREELRESYLQSRLNSIATLRVAQPVRRVGESLMPYAGVPYHTIAGHLAGKQPPGDGVVPLDSALLPGAASTLVIDSDHYIYQQDQAVDEMVRILREAASSGS